MKTLLEVLNEEYDQAAKALDKLRMTLVLIEDGLPENEPLTSKYEAREMGASELMTTASTLIALDVAMRVEVV